MKISRSTVHVLIVLEVIVLIMVIALSVLHPWTTTPKHDLVSESTEEGDNDNRIPEYTKPEVTEEILAVVEEMSIEKKVAQMLITTFEELTDAEEVTKLNKTLKSAIKKYPLGGILYAEALEEEDSTLIEDVKAFYLEETNLPVCIVEDVRFAYQDLKVLSLENMMATSEQPISAKEAAIMAVQADCDMLYCKEEFKEAYEGILEAVEEGEITEEAIDAAVARILAYKGQLEE